MDAERLILQYDQTDPSNKYSLVDDFIAYIDFIKEQMRESIYISKAANDQLGIRQFFDQLPAPLKSTFPQAMQLL